jgi:hypothetical protein
MSAIAIYQPLSRSQGPRGAATLIANWSWSDLEHYAATWNILLDDTLGVTSKLSSAVQIARTNIWRCDLNHAQA